MFALIAELGAKSLLSFVKKGMINLYNKRIHVSVFKELINE